MIHKQRNYRRSVRKGRCQHKDRRVTGRSEFPFDPFQSCLDGMKGHHLALNKPGTRLEKQCNLYAKIAVIPRGKPVQNPCFSSAAAKSFLAKKASKFLDCLPWAVLGDVQPLRHTELREVSGSGGHAKAGHFGFD